MKCNYLKEAVLRDRTQLTLSPVQSQTYTMHISILYNQSKDVSIDCRSNSQCPGQLDWLTAWWAFLPHWLWCTINALHKLNTQLSNFQTAKPESMWLSVKFSFRPSTVAQHWCCNWKQGVHIPSGWKQKTDWARPGSNYKITLNEIATH